MLFDDFISHHFYIFLFMTIAVSGKYKNIYTKYVRLSIFANGLFEIYSLRAKNLITFCVTLPVPTYIFYLFLKVYCFIF